MKHDLKITIFLVSVFFITQAVGLLIVGKYLNTTEVIDPETQITTKEVVPEDLPYDIQRPEVNQSTSFIWIVAAIIVGTALVLILIRYRRMNLWKLWFFVAVFLTMSVAFSAFIHQTAAAVLALILSLIKVYRPTSIIQNLTEIFIYGGLAAIFVPIINIFAAIVLLIIISIYDIIAVNKTKHMVTLARFQAQSRVFAGLLIPYGKSKNKPAKASKGKGVKTAVLGGGDIGFPLIFAGVVMKDLMLTSPEPTVFLKTLLIPIFAAAALLFLLINGKQDKFYPAMPYITAGCFIGYAVVLLF
jgi:presenilin-like A22 family membrane protease